MNPVRLSEFGLKEVRDSEALRLHAYPDPESPLAKASPKAKWGFVPADEELAGLLLNVRILSGKPWTIGYGMTSYPDGSPVQPGDACTQQQAEEWLRVTVGRYERAVSESVTAPYNQKMFDAMVNMAYNIGAHAFRTSTFVKLLNAEQYIEAQREFDKWVRSHGEVSSGLVKRRNREQRWFNDGIREALADQPYALASFNAAVGDEGVA